MRRVAVLLPAVTLMICGAPAGARQPQASTQQAESQKTPASRAELEAAVAELGSFEFEVRTDAARRLRRAAAGDVVPVLAAAARSHRDEYARFRALVLLSGFGGPAAASAMRDLKDDRNDRLRTVAFSWFAYHPEPSVLPSLLEALETERSEFVRPALTRAVAALGAESRARDAIRPLVLRGEDFFRGAVIEALGDFGGTYALPDILEVARLDGPLQDDAISAIGKLGDRSMVRELAAIQKTAPREVQPTIVASLCLLGVNCEQATAYLADALEFGASDEVNQPMVRGVAHALGLLAARGRKDALALLLDRGVPSKDPVRSPLALSAGLVAMRNPELLMSTLEERVDRKGAVELLRDAFDMLNEDFEEERFYVAVRRAYWAAADGSPRRAVAELLIQMLEF